MTPSSAFGPSEAEPAALDGAAVAVWPVPYERTTSYGRGAARGPAAILEASGQLELWDERSRRRVGTSGVATLPSFQAPAEVSVEEALRRMTDAARDLLATGRRLVALGGEHGITPAIARAAWEVHGEIGVVHFDAHADLRTAYEGSSWSHACALARVRDLGIPTLSLGIRALSEEEAAVVATGKLPVVWGWELSHLTPSELLALLDPLPRRIYLTFDLDFFDPAILPATGTPEPGGGRWWPTLDLLEVLFAEKEVIAADCVELAPIPGQPASDFLAARLVWKWIDLWERASGGGWR